MARGHLIAFPSSLKSDHETAFREAAGTLKKDYQRFYPSDASPSVKFMSNGHEITKFINEYNGEIASLDIVSHGDPLGIHIATPIKNVTYGLLSGISIINARTQSVVLTGGSSSNGLSVNSGLIGNVVVGLYTDEPAAMSVAAHWDQCVVMDTAMGMLIFASTLACIDYGKFVKSAFVEFHGCNIATDQQWGFAQKFSDRLGNDALVVAHTTGSSPTGGIAYNYRHGRVRVYSNGRVVKDNVERSTQKFPNSSTPG